MYVDLGCGKHKKPGFYGIDKYPDNDVDLVADIEDGIPIGTNMVDYLYSSHCLEHIYKLEYIIYEIHRICKPDGIVEIHLPYFTLPPYEDHVHRGFRYNVFSDYEVDNICKMIGKKSLFKCIYRKLIFTGIYKLFSKLFNCFPKFYENSFLKYIIPCFEIEIKFKVIK